MNCLFFFLAPVCFLAALRIGRIFFPGDILRDRYLCGIFHAGAGLLILSFLFLMMVLTGFATSERFWAAGVLCLVLALLELVRCIAKGRKIQGFLKFHWIPFLLLACYFIFQSAMTFLPPLARDELIYHLYVPQKWLETSGGFFFQDNIYAYFPQLADLYFLFGLGTFGENAAKFFHVAWGALLALALFRFSRKWLSRFMSWLPVLVFLTIPSVIVTMNWAYVDLTFSFYALMALALFLEFQETKNFKTWIACAVMAGGAAATKYTGIQLTLLLACLFLIQNRKQTDRKAIIVPLGALGGIVLLVLVPYLIRNWIITGWPIFPFSLPGFVLHSVNWDVNRARLFTEWLQTFGTRIGAESFWDTLLAPLRVFTVARFNDHTLFEGMIGPVFLAVPFLFWKRKVVPGIPTLGFFSGFFVFYWMFTTKQVRFLLPVLPVLSILLVYGAKESGKKWILSMVVILSVGFSWFGFREIAKTDPLVYWRGRENREDFLSRRIDVYSVYRAADKVLKTTDRLYLLDMKNYGYFLRTPWRGDYVFEHYSLEQCLKHSGEVAEIRKFFSRMGITHILMNQEMTFSRESGLEEKEGKVFAAFLKQDATPEMIRGKYVLFKLKGALSS